MSYKCVIFAVQWQRREKEKERSSRENLGKFFYDLAKATFTIMVLTNTVTILTSDNYKLAAVMFLWGMPATIVLARVGYLTIKK